MSADLAIREDQNWWTQGQMVALKGTLGLQAAKEAELAVFFHVCKRTQLDPFMRQIHYIKRRAKNDFGDYVDRWTVQVGIDGFRVIRDRAARRDGAEITSPDGFTRREPVSVEYAPAIWYDADGGEHDVWLSQEAPAACKFTVLKDGRPFTAVAVFSAYAQTYKPRPTQDNPEPAPRLTEMWSRMGYHQIAKCAEALALRMAFPQDLSGVYLEEELQHSEEGQAPRQPRARKGHAGSPRLRPEDPDGRASSQPDAYDEPRAPHNRTEALEQLHGLFRRADFTEQDRALRLWITSQLAAPDGERGEEITSSDVLDKDQALQACRMFKAVMRRCHQDDLELREALEEIATSTGWTEPEEATG